MPKQRLILLFDGTWNDPEDQTNVYQFSRLIRDYDGSVCQRFFYDPGVGTSRRSRFRGGVFGFGLSENLRQGYDWLARNYTSDDEIWILGFSRGAYTARSLVGMMRKCGLLHISTPQLLKRAEQIYRTKEYHPDSWICQQFRRRYSQDVRIHFIGVWDTVGSLGVPGTFLSEKGKFAWHDTQLSKIVRYAYHAVALDEFREAYNVALWTHPEGDKKVHQEDVEQRWFIGAHANVGGGYGDDPLAVISLKWMRDKAYDAGLKLHEVRCNQDAWMSNPVPSFDNFLRGGYAFFKRLSHGGTGEFYRHFHTGARGLPAVNVTVDDSVWLRWHGSNGHYRPRTLTNARQSPPEG
ncbi:DUF2235 domain-containing protein [Microbulbifer sediminum]|uniref:DUF2235 domain-containing protein n=1 Tax=Microbulbifer sediminum TaxID=2904250 RepID=UPI001F1D6126|nr:DUF2235 domain-containing protein [Microbulbifer sediminum]